MSHEPGGVAVVVLAAGAATRFGSAKQVLLLPGVLDRVRAAAPDRIVVVEGAYRLGDVGSDVDVVACADWERGPGASLRAGLAQLGPETAHAVIVLADGPALASAAITRVVEVARAEDVAVVAATYGGDRGHPVAVARSAWNAVPDGGLRAVEAHPVACDDLGAPGDIDRPDDLASPPTTGR